VRSHKVSLAAANLADIEAIFGNLEADGRRTLERSGAREAITFARSVDMRFVGQGSETNVPVPEADFTNVAKETLRARFDEIYTRLYGRTYPDSPVELINFKVRASLPERLLDLPRIGDRGRTEDAIKGEREAYSGLAGRFVPFTVYDRYRLSPGARLHGPAIVEERESTVVAGEDASLSVDEYGFIWIEIGEA
jgi:N-methylhydantoinase A